LEPLRVWSKPWFGLVSVVKDSTLANQVSVVKDSTLAIDWEGHSGLPFGLVLRGFIHYCSRLGVCRDSISSGGNQTYFLEVVFLSRGLEIFLLG
jgi:hypothetical protein